MRLCAALSKIDYYLQPLSLIVNESKKLRITVPKMGNLENYRSAIQELL